MQHNIIQNAIPYFCFLAEINNYSCIRTFI